MHRLLIILVLATSPALAAPRLRLVAGEREPADGRRALDPDALAELRQAVESNPKDRGKRFALIQALIAGNQLKDALKEAQAWREKDAYNLVVVRLIGDIEAELGARDAARRTYSAVVELLPNDAQAHRALSTVLKQNGELSAAYDRLQSAARLAPRDQRIAFELADVCHRLGRTDEALTRFEQIVHSDDAPEALRYPAKQRLAQIYAAERRDAKGDQARAELSDKIAELDVKGGVENDLKIYLTWDTDKSDVDLWVTNPSGEKIFYSHRTGAPGEALFDDVTTGYGPESFTAKSASPGSYLVQVNYYGTNRSAFTEARGEVVVILSEGTAAEERHVLPYRLYEPKQTVSVAKIEVSK
jgi:Flp pilus assembly protein TadD